jgi:hypothetical protein
MQELEKTCKASKLIEKLQSIVSNKGDIDVYLRDPDTDWLMALSVEYCEADDEGQERIEMIGGCSGRSDCDCA